MASENQGSDNTLPESAALWNGNEGFAFPLLHSEASHSGIRDSDPLSFLQLQVSPPPMGNLYGEPATNHVGHASSDSLSTMMSNVTQDNAVPSFSALNGRQSYDLNRNVQLLEVPPGIRSILQLDNNRSPINIGGERDIFRHGPDNWVIPGAPQFDSSTLDGSFLSLGHRGSAGSRLESYASARDYNSNRLSFIPFGQEIHQGPFKPIDDVAHGSYSQNLAPSGNIGCLTLSHTNNGTLPGLTSGFDVSPSLPSSGQLIGVNQCMPASNDRSSPIMENDMNSRYTDPGSKVYQTVPSGLYTNIQYGSSESGYSWMSRLPSEAVTTRISQQSIAEDNQGINLTSNALFPFQSPTYFPTLGTSSSRMDQLNLVADLASQERIMHPPTSESFDVLPIAADQAVAASIRSKLINDSNAARNSPLKRGPSSVLNVTPRKLMRQHTVSPSHLHVNPAQLQNFVLKRTGTPPAFTNIPQQQLHPSFPSPIQNTRHQNTLGNTVPAFTPFANNRSPIDPHPNTIPAPEQNCISNSTNAYPNSSSLGYTNITQSAHHPFLVPQAQTAHLQKVSPSMEHPFYRPFAMSPMQYPLERRTPGFSTPSNVSCSSTYFPKAVPQPSIGASGNSFRSSNHTAQGSLSISAKKPPAVPVASTKTASSTARDRLGVKYSTVVQRFIERQSHALAAFEKKLPPDAPVTTSSTPHIKWQQGLEKREASGLKCLLCKRDLAYTPEGPVSIPAIPPEVAVLFCGHVFHDHCLQGITPQDQQASPPCIPCSMGEPCA